MKNGSKMIYIGETAKIIYEHNELYHGLDNNRTIKVIGYYKIDNSFVTFDNLSGDFFVEVFQKESIAIAWAFRVLECSDRNEKDIVKILPSIISISRHRFLKLKIYGDFMSAKLFFFNFRLPIYFKLMKRYHLYN